MANPSYPVTSAIEGGELRFSSEDQAVDILNRLEATLLLVRDSYLANPATYSAQSAALTEFDAAWVWLKGKDFGLNTRLDSEWRRNGVSDRNRGGKYDWFAAYRDPIANDPRLLGGFGGSLTDAAGAVGLSATQLGAVVVAVGLGLWWFLRRRRA